jgi:hypothetical protein
MKQESNVQPMLGCNELTIPEERSYPIFGSYKADGIRFATLKGKALTNVLSHLRVKKNFVDLSHKMSPEDWRQVSHKLKNAEGEQKMYARSIKDDQGNTEIVETFAHNPRKKRPDDASYNQYF